MREIKFRVWTGATMEYNVTAGKFGTFYVNPGAKGDGLDEKDNACLSPFNTVYPSTMPVMQFTGLKDKNGVEIYEGDILETLTKTRGEVKFEGFGWTFYHIPLSNWGGSKGLKVIGNIYQNPELLK